MRNPLQVVRKVEAVASQQGPALWEAGARRLQGQEVLHDRPVAQAKVKFYEKLKKRL